MNLKGKTVFITGSAKRIGREIAMFFAKNGCNVCLHYHLSETDVLQLRSDILKTNVECKTYKADLQNTKESVLALERAKSDFGKIEFLINNASVFIENSIMNISEEEFERDFSIHAKTPLFLIQSFARQEFKDEEGLVVNMIDKNIIRKRSKFVSYLLAKKSLLEITSFAAFELAPKIRVNAISPGFILHEEYRLQTSSTEELATHEALSCQSIPLKRKGDVKDIILALQFLINTPYITGHNIPVDGGSSLY